jgi:hypothetical protein
MPDLMIEVANFRKWADAYAIERSGEWECVYPEWGGLYEAVLEFIAAQPIESWTAEEREVLIYTVARDNEMQHLSREIRSRQPDLLLALAKAAAESSEPDAKWQIAEELGQLGTKNAEIESLLVHFAHDSDEYVRRRSLKSLARLHSPAVEELALAEWNRPDEYQQWSRMGVLWCLNHIGSTALEEKLREAEQDERQYLSAFACQVRRGEVDG